MPTILKTVENLEGNESQSEDEVVTQERDLEDENWSGNEDEKVMTKKRHFEEDSNTIEEQHDDFELSKRQLQFFHRYIWPSLEEVGWTKRNHPNDPSNIQYAPPTTTSTTTAITHTCIQDVLNYLWNSSVDSIEHHIQVAYKDRWDALRMSHSELTFANDNDMVESTITKTRRPRGRPRKGTNPPFVLDPSERSIITRNKESIVPITTTAPIAPRPRGRPRKQSNLPPILDLSWKDGRTSYPVASSRIGYDFQVPFIPTVESFSYDESQQKQESNLEFDVLWDPNKAQETGIFDWIQTNTRFRNPEAILAIAHECDYQSDKIHQRLENHIEFTWTQDQMTQFHAEIFRHRKNLVTVAKIMNLPVSTVYVYYLSHYKKSNDYRLLKWVCEEERQTKLEESEQGWEGCVECGEGGNLLICDGCDAEYHMMCTKPPLMEVPEGAWYCDVCVDTQFLAVRDHVIAKFYKPVHPSNPDITNKELVDKERDNITVDDVALRPVEAVVKAVKNLAITLSQALKT